MRCWLFNTCGRSLSCEPFIAVRVFPAQEILQDGGVQALRFLCEMTGCGSREKEWGRERNPICCALFPSQDFSAIMMFLQGVYNKMSRVCNELSGLDCVSGWVRPQSPLLWLPASKGVGLPSLFFSPLLNVLLYIPKICYSIFHFCVFFFSPCLVPLIVPLLIPRSLYCSLFLFKLV